MDQTGLLEQRVRELENENQKLRQANKLAALLNLTFTETQKELFHSKLLFKTILDQIPYGIYWKDLNSNFLGCNEIFLEEFDIPDPSLLIGNSDLSGFTNDSYSSVFEMDAEVLKSGTERLNHKELHFSNDNSIKWLQTSRLPISDKDGKIIGLLGIVQDITQQISDQAEKGKMITGLKLLEDIINGGFSIAFILCNDSRFSIEFVTQNIKLLGYDPSDFYSGKLNFCDIVNTDDFTKIHNQLSQSEFIINNIEFRLRKNDGTEIWVSCNFKKINGAENETTHYQAILIDINELKNALNQLEVKNAEIQLRNEEFQAQNEEFYTINEELKNSIDELNQLHQNYQKSEAKFNAIASLEGFGIAVISNNSISYSNNAFNNFFNCNTPNENCNIEKWFSQFDNENRVILQTLIDTDKTSKLSLKLMRGHEPLWFEVSSQQLINHHNEPSVLLTFSDITSRKLLSEALQEASQGLNVTLNSISDAVITLSDSLRVKNLNTAAEKIIGITLKQARYKYFPKLISENNETDILSRFLQEVQVKGYEMDYANQLEIAGNKFTLCATPIAKADKSAAGIVILIRNQGDNNIMQASNELQAQTHVKTTDETILRSIVDNSGDGIALIDYEGRIYEWNHAMETISGFSKNDIHGQSAWEIQAISDILDNPQKLAQTQISGNIKKLLDDAKKGYYVHTFESALKTKDHKHKRIQTVVFPVNIADKQLIGMIVRDITDKYQVEQNLKKNKALLQSILDCSPVAVFVINTDGVFEMINKSFEEIFAVKKHNIHGKKAIQMFPGFTDAFNLPDNLEEIEDYFYQTERNFFISNTEKTFIINKASFYDSAEKTYKIAGVLMDISQRINAEKQMKESEELYRQLIVTSPEAIVLTDKGGNFLFFSPKAIEMFLATDEDILKNNKLYHYVNQAHLGSAVASIQSVWHEGYSYGQRYLFKRTDGTTFNGEVNSALVRDHQGNPKAMLSVIRDISDRIKFEEELIKAKEKAEESDKLKSSFLANMSHEIRTPMNAIIGFSTLLLDDTISDEMRREYVNIISSNGSSLMGLIDDIIDFSKIESNQLKINSTAFNLDKLLYELKTLFDETVQLKGMGKLILKFDDNLAFRDKKILADPIRIKQVLINLITNAIKFTDTGFIKFGYQVIEGNYLKFYVKDTGIGLSSDKHELIFERFRQVEEDYTRKYGGTGLGLAICRSLVKLMGGEIWLESEENKGSQFFFTIPYKPEIEEKNNILQSEIVFSQKNLPDWTNKTILVAEDEYVNYKFIYEGLKRTGAKTIHVENGMQAVKAVQDNPAIALVLMDIKMPVMNGLDATREIKHKRPDLPIIAQTAFAMEEDRKNIIECGCEDYMTKPLDLNQLIIMISKYMK